MNSRFTQGVSATMAAVLLSMSTGLSASRPGAAQNCDYGRNGNTNNGAGPSDNNYTVNNIRSSATTPKPTCDGNICTYPCPNGDGYCTCPARGTQDGPSGRQRGGGGDGGGGILPWIIGGFAVAVGAAVAADQLTGKDWVNSQELDARGPRFPMEQKTGRFQVQGYAASYWPFALDISTEPGTRTWLEVRFKGDDRSQSVDLTRAEGGRRVEYIQLPAASGGIRVARYSIHSALMRPGHEPLYRPMMVYGIGAGPGAVGALQSDQSSLNADGTRKRLAGRATFAAPRLAFLQAASVAPAQLAALLGASGLAAAAPPAPRFGSYLAVTAFGPQYPSRPSEVGWAVAAQQSFQKSELDVLQLPGDGNGKLIEIVKADLDLFASPKASGSWSGVPLLAGISPGIYQLQARAWRTKQGGGDWTGAFAPDYVYIR